MPMCFTSPVVIQIYISLNPLKSLKITSKLNKHSQFCYLSIFGFLCRHSPTISYHSPLHCTGGYAKFTGLKTYNKQLKTMIAIGGWNEASSRFSPLMANPERRQQFIKNILKFLRQNHFDGIDLDWEYPAQREGGKPRDRDNYAQFVQELRAEFERESQKTGRPRLLLTMAVPAGIENIEKGYDIPKLNKYLDWFNVLSYDFHSSHEPSANHHAPLYSLEEESEYNYDAELNIVSILKLCKNDD